MFKIPVSIKNSTIPGVGVGVFTLVDIKARDIVWEFDEGMDIKIPEYKVLSLDLTKREYFFKYAWRQGDYFYLPCDHNKFINHSSNPNLMCLNTFPMKDIAVRDILAGEELFTNYSSFDDDYSLYSHEFN